MTLIRISPKFIREGLSPRRAQCAKLGFCASTSATVHETGEFIYSAEVAWLLTRDLRAVLDQGT